MLCHILLLIIFANLLVAAEDDSASLPDPFADSEVGAETAPTAQARPQQVLNQAATAVMQVDLGSLDAVVTALIEAEDGAFRAVVVIRNAPEGARRVRLGPDSALRFDWTSDHQGDGTPRVVRLAAEVTGADKNGLRLRTEDGRSLHLPFANTSASRETKRKRRRR